MEPPRRHWELLLERGGAGRIAFLRYCVMSITMEPVFMFLAAEFRLQPGHARALALYDLFCAPGAPARIAADPVLAPRSLRLASAAAVLRDQWRQLQAPGPPDGGIATSVPLHGMFDGVRAWLRSDPDGRLAGCAGGYDPQRAPHQNLPGGRMTASQRQFVDTVWRPQVRPRLVEAGFWQMQTIE